MKLTYLPVLVVDCYQIVSLSKESTAMFLFSSVSQPLWIAIKLYLCPRNQQPGVHAATFAPCCGLLSNCIFVQGINSNYLPGVSATKVVDCYQIVSLSKESTALKYRSKPCYKLWIAIKLYLCPRNQQHYS